MFTTIPTIFKKNVWDNGSAPGQFYNCPITLGSHYTSSAMPCPPPEYAAPGLFGTCTHSSSPITTGTSVLGIKFDGGVMIAADNLISYGSLARYQDVQRVFKINAKTVLGAGGDFADFQSLKRSIDQKIVEDMYSQDDIDMKPRSLFSWLTRILYNRRSRINPLWLEIVVGGMDERVPFLGTIDLRGSAYEDNVVATGFGKHLALPLAREYLVRGGKLTQQQASDVLRKCMEVLYYRDCRAMPQYSVAICTKECSDVVGPFQVGQNWHLAATVKGY